MDDSKRCIKPVYRTKKRLNLGASIMTLLKRYNHVVVRRSQDKYVVCILPGDIRGKDNGNTLKDI